MSIALDPREILAHLNKLGYRNITAKQLKDFMTGLKQLIKYEAKYSNVNQFIEQLLTPTTTPAQVTPQAVTAINIPHNNNNNNNKNPKPINNFERLYKTPTISSRANTVTTKNCVKSENIKYTCCTLCKSKPFGNSCEKIHHKPINVLNCRPEFNLDTNIIENSGKKKPNLILRESTNIENSHPASQYELDHHQHQHKYPLARNSAKTQTSANQQWVRNNPTDLYQHYQRDWQRFKNLIPGENSRSNIRQTIHRRMEHKPPQKSTVYVKYLEDQTKEIKS